MQTRGRRNEAYINKKQPKINPFVIKSVLESNYKRFRKIEIRENFNLKPETQMKKLIQTTEATISINAMN